jgi:hypothetical protein
LGLQLIGLVTQLIVVFLEGDFSKLIADGQTAKIGRLFTLDGVGILVTLDGFFRIRFARLLRLGSVLVALFSGRFLGGFILEPFFLRPVLLPFGFDSPTRTLVIVGKKASNPAGRLILFNSWTEIAFGRPICPGHGA